jgi:hypothetical protein
MSAQSTLFVSNSTVRATGGTSATGIQVNYGHRRSRDSLVEAQFGRVRHRRCDDYPSRYAGSPSR